MMEHIEKSERLDIKFRSTPSSRSEITKKFSQKLQNSEASPTITKMTALAHPEMNEITLVGVPDIANNNKKRGGRRRSRKTPSVASDDSTCETSSSDSSACKPRRRGRPQKKKKNSEQEQQEATLSLEEKAQYVALDCEMVGIGFNGIKSIVAKVTLVGWNGETLFDEFIKPDHHEVTDYRTFVSGITEADLERAEIDIHMCRERVQDIIEDKILVGHALKNDMRALEINHPWFMTRDTAKYEPFMQVRFQDGVLWPRKLKELVKEKLNKEIQVIGKPHSAYEDALAALDLYRTARRKWEKAMHYKIKKTNEIQTKKGTLPHPQKALTN